jgi:hypothetical protein
MDVLGMSLPSEARNLETVESIEKTAFFDESRPTDHDSRTPTYKYTK